MYSTRSRRIPANKANTLCAEAALAEAATSGKRVAVIPGGARSAFLAVPTSAVHVRYFVKQQFLASDGGGVSTWQHVREGLPLHRLAKEAAINAAVEPGALPVDLPVTYDGKIIVCRVWAQEV